MSRLKMAVVGVGALGRHHARILSEFDRVDLIAVADTNAETGARVAEQCHTQYVTDYRQLLDQVDAVAVAVPTTLHLSVASDFLARRVPALVEKPLACDFQQAKQLAGLAKKSGTLLQVGHVERFNPAAQVAMKQCGPPKYVRAERLSPYSFRSIDIGVVHDLMIHDIDLILELVDSPVERVDAFGICIMGGHEDSVQARLTFQNGCIADLTSSRVHPNAKRSMQIWSADSCVTVDYTTREVVCFSPSETLRFGTSPVERAKQPEADIEQLRRDVFGKFLNVVKPDVPRTDALTAELCSFVDCVLQGTRPVVGPEAALDAMRVAERILDAVATQRWDHVPESVAAA